MKKFITYLAALTLVLMVYSCGSGGGAPHLGGGSSIGSQSTQPATVYNIDQQDPSKSVIPFPNDLVLNGSSDLGPALLQAVEGSTKSLTRTEGVDSSTSNLLAFYTALIALKLEGFSPNTPVIIPVPKGVQLNENELQENIKAIDLTRFIEYVIGNFLLTGKYTPTSANDYCALFSSHQDNDTLAIGCAETILGYYANTNPQELSSFISGISPYIYTPLVVKQDVSNGIVYGYPVVPFNPGDKYVAVVQKGINGLNPSLIGQWLIGYGSSSDKDFQQLKPLREAYVGILPLLSALGIQKSNINEMTTFTVADKTLGLTDYGIMSQLATGLENGSIQISDLINALQAYVGNECDATSNHLCTILNNILENDYEYSDLDNMTYAGPSSENEYLQIDGLSDLPLVCQDLYDNATIRQAYGLHQITNLSSEMAILLNSTSLDNVTPYILTPNVYEISAIMTIIDSNTSDNGTLNYPEICKEIFDNATLYDNVTTVIYPPKTQLTDLKGFLIFQHGLGRDKSDGGILASDIQDFGKYIIFAMDLPWHGNRIPPNPMFASQASACQKSGSCYLTANPINDVMNIYQSLLDMHTFTKFVYASDVETMAKVGTTLTGNPLPPLPVYFAGQSMGSITGSMLLNIDNITQSKALQIAGLPANNYISKAVLNVGGANYSAIINGATNPEIAALGEAATGGKYSKNQVGYNLAIALFQLVLDPVDPSFMARNPNIKSKIIMQNVEGDTLVPNTSNELLYYAYNYNYNKLPSYPFTRVKPNYISYDNSTISATAGKWYMFEGDAQYPWINHGFIIHTADTQDALDTMYPSTVVNGKPMINLDYANKAEALARQQMCTFLSPVPIP